jgi:hypothetical protein
LILKESGIYAGFLNFFCFFAKAAGRRYSWLLHRQHKGAKGTFS